LYKRASASGKLNQTDENSFLQYEGCSTFAKKTDMEISIVKSVPHLDIIKIYFDTKHGGYDR
jgi:hypothetical protein